MRLYAIRTSVVVVVMSLVLLTPYAAKPDSSLRNQAQLSETQSNRAKEASAANWIFEGCFAFFAAGPCYDVFRDSSGNYWICSKCGETNNPGPGKCRQLTAYELSHGFWCS